MIPTSIDGTDITGATIDGTDVQEITVDGQTVFTAGAALPQNPTSRWTFEGDTLDTIGSNDFSDNSGAGFSTTTFKQGSQSCEFSDSTPHILVNNNIQNFETSGFTLTGWFYRDDRSDRNMMFITDEDNNGARGFQAKVDSNDKLAIFSGNTFEVLSLTTPFNQWYFFGMSVTSGGFSIFDIDGTQQTRSFSYNSGQNHPLCIGDRRVLSGQSLPCRYVDDVRYYTRALSASELDDVRNDI